MRSRRLYLFVFAAVLAASIVAVPAFGQTSSRGSASGGTLQFAVVQPATGPDADFAIHVMAGCAPAAIAIDGAGGILGHQIQCTLTDTRGDPADAVPAVNKLLATASNLVGIIGPSSDEATTVAPLINRAHIPFMTESGQSFFDHSPYPYFFRIIPPDDASGYAMALLGHERHFKSAAIVVGTDIGSQAVVKTLDRGLQNLGSPRVVVHDSITFDQPSYRTEVEKLIAAHPQVIFEELDPQTAATFHSELQELAGKQLPVIATGTNTDPAWYKAMVAAVGKQALSRDFEGTGPAVVSSGPAWAAYRAALLKSGKQVSNPGQYSTDGFPQAFYDSATIMAIAMLEAHTTTPSAYNAYIPKVVAASHGAVVVHSFAQAKKELAAGHRIQYVGVTGQMAFDRWRNSPGSLQIFHWTTSGQQARVPGTPTLTAKQLVALTK